jgi:hypothetical protein
MHRSARDSKAVANEARGARTNSTMVSDNAVVYASCVVRAPIEAVLSIGRMHTRIMALYVRVHVDIKLMTSCSSKSVGVGNSRRNEKPCGWIVSVRWSKGDRTADASLVGTSPW